MSLVRGGRRERAATATHNAGAVDTGDGPQAGEERMPRLSIGKVSSIG